jgi:hypothetical protein
LGHSCSLALSVFNIINIKQELIEFLIPITILATCAYNLKGIKDQESPYFNARYWMAFLFGMIHGLGFSTILRSFLGHDQNILSPLFAFNLGLEAGQLIILGGIVVFSVVLTYLFTIRKQKLNIFISSAIFAIAFILAIIRFVYLVRSSV